jgi:hypothetical protein
MIRNGFQFSVFGEKQNQSQRPLAETENRKPTQDYLTQGLRSLLPPPFIVLKGEEIKGFLFSKFF